MLIEILGSEPTCTFTTSSYLFMVVSFAFGIVGFTLLSCAIGMFGDGLRGACLCLFGALACLVVMYRILWHGLDLFYCIENPLTGAGSGFLVSQALTEPALPHDRSILRSRPALLAWTQAEGKQDPNSPQKSE